MRRKACGFWAADLSSNRIPVLPVIPVRPRGTHLTSLTEPQGSPLRNRGKNSTSNFNLLGGVNDSSLPSEEHQSVTLISVSLARESCFCLFPVMIASQC